MDKFKPCGCLTDGRNWLPECKEHEKVRRDLKRVVAELKRLCVEIPAQLGGAPMKNNLLRELGEQE